ncbi:hypothetical protein LTR33_016392 [Friedmanniomyces endolithicus]|nr:hypothetical protein LTR33_016392 [Friedmanniomyces endolithicus]
MRGMWSRGGRECVDALWTMQESALLRQRLSEEGFEGSSQGFLLQEVSMRDRLIDGVQCRSTRSASSSAWEEDDVDEIGHDLGAFSSLHITPGPSVKCVAEHSSKGRHFGYVEGIVS